MASPRDQKERKMRVPTLAAVAALAICTVAIAPASANLSDDFESGVNGAVWAKWSGGSQEILQSDSSHNHTPAGSKAARAYEADPTAYSAYADFGSTDGFVRADVWLFEDLSHDGTNPSQPVTNMLCLIGDTGGAVGFGADYLQLGVVPFWPGGSTTYGWRSKYGDANQGGSQSVGVARKQGWTHLAIEADALGSGGQVRFYIDGTQVGTTQRSANKLRWVRLGNNSKSYENFWYDDVNVVPEPGSILALGAGLVGFAGALRRRK